MRFEWSSELAIGVPDIDDQHRELFARVDRLIGAIHAGAGRQHVDEVVSFLTRYVVEHFEAEELLMESEGYPAITTHRAQHIAFRADLEPVARVISSGQANELIVHVVHGRVCDWLLRHVSGADMEFGSYHKAWVKQAA